MKNSDTTYPEWIDRLFNIIDDKNTDGFLTFLSDDAEVRFGNGPTQKGKTEIFEGIDQFFSYIESIEHSLSNVWKTDHAVIVEGRVTYTRHDESTLTFPFCNVLHQDSKDQKKISRYYVYVDQSPLFAEPQ